MDYSHLLPTQVIDIPAGVTVSLGTDKCYHGPLKGVTVPCSVATALLKQDGYPQDAKSCWPSYCRVGPAGVFTMLTNGSQVVIPAGEVYKMPVPTHPNENCGKPNIVDIKPLCPAKYLMALDVEPQVAEVGKPILDGSAAHGNATARSLFVDEDCNIADFVCIKNLDTANDLPINFFWYCQ